MKKAALGLIILATCAVSGCFTRATGPQLPYVRPAESVPQVDQTPLHLAARVEDMEREIQRLRDMVERFQASGANEQTIRNLQDRVSAIETQLGIVQRSQGTGAPAPQSQEPGASVAPQGDGRAATPPAPVMKSDHVSAPVEIQNTPVAPDEKIYRDAYQAYKGRSLDQAVNLFEELLKKFPKSQLASDAIYWIGEARLAQGRYDDAVLQFDRVLKEFPGSKKELDALLKQGQAFEKMGDSKSAKIIFQKLVTDNPHTAQGRIAAGRLKSLASH